MAPVENIAVSTQTLRQRLLQEGMSEAAIRDCEQIMRNEFASLTQKQLETKKMDMEKTVVDESQRQLNDDGASSSSRQDYGGYYEARSAKSGRFENIPLASADRLSGLPDEILCRILSFLPTKISVQTSILSRRWRFMWAYVPNLIFECGEKEDIINRAFIRRKVKTVNTFRTTAYLEKCTDIEIETWMILATPHNLQNLEIRDLADGVILPRCIFTCTTLVDLRLSRCNVNLTGCAACLPRLKTLHLIGCYFENDETFPYLLSVCPVLEELGFVRAFFPFGHTRFDISSPTIKRLTVHIDFEPRRSRYRESKMTNFRLTVNTPALEYLQISASFYTGDFMTRENGEMEWGRYLHTSCEAYIYPHKNDQKQFDLVYQESVLEFISWLGLLNFECLQLRLSYHMEIVDAELSSWTLSFHNLTELELTTDRRFLSKFLQSADNLRVLIFSEISTEDEKGWIEPQQMPTHLQSHLYVEKSSEFNQMWIEPQQVPPCLVSRLKVIKLVNMVDESNIFEIVEYLLKNARVLERMEIECPEQKIDMIEDELLLFERASDACEVVLVDAVNGPA